MEWPCLQQTRFFKLRRQPGAVAVVEDSVTDQVVSLGAVPPTGANQAVIPENIKDAFTHRADRFFCKEWVADPALDCRGEKLRVNAVADGWVW